MQVRGRNLSYTKHSSVSSTNRMPSHLTLYGLHKHKGDALESSRSNTEALVTSWLTVCWCFHTRDCCHFIHVIFVTLKTVNTLILGYDSKEGRRVRRPKGAQKWRHPSGCLHRVYRKRAAAYYQKTRCFLFYCILTTDMPLEQQEFVSSFCFLPFN